MTTIILDCYTDEASGLGVPPYFGTYPRYLAGYLESIGEKWAYITIDDLRAWKTGKAKGHQKTNIKKYNLTNQDIGKLLGSSRIIVILGVHVPGKYLSAVPGTLNEVKKLLEEFRGEKVLTGPAVIGTISEGGERGRKEEKFFDRIEKFDFSYEKIAEYAVKGAKLFEKIPGYRIIEIETGKGCPRKCSFCTEPLKSRLEFRQNKDILAEIDAYYKLGARYFRLGKQTDFYLNSKAGELLRAIRKRCNKIEVLHIDNVNPQMVLGERGIQLTKDIVKYCTPGNVAALGVESFDPEIVEKNNLCTTAEQTYEAVKIINKYGASCGDNGMPKYLPGINLIFGLNGERKQTHEENMSWLKKMLDEGLLIRRINIRQVSIFEGTPMWDIGKKFIRKNKKYYWKWRNEIRQNIDFPMLRKIVPAGTVLKNVTMEIHDGKTTFGRQIGSYPLIIGVKERLDLGKFYDIMVTGHMLRSITGIRKV